MSKKWAIRLLRGTVWVPLIGYWAWSLGAAWHFNVAPTAIRLFLFAILLLGPLVVSIRWRRFFRVGVAIASAVGLMAILWQFMTPSNDRNWHPEVAHPPTLVQSDDSLRIANYQTIDGLENHELDMNKLKRVWLGVEKFPDFDGGAHNFLTFEFEDRFVSVSVEARKEVGEEYGLLPALFRQFELVYLIGDEVKVFAARTDFASSAYLFPLKSTASQRRQLLSDIAARANQLATEPEWYNILTNNCTNNLAWHASHIAPRTISSYDLRVIMTGHVDRLLHEMNVIDASGELSALEERFRVDQTGTQLPLDLSFSKSLRSGIFKE